MKFSTIPKTELKVSKIMLGTMTWGQQNTEAEAHEQLDYAVSQGINFIDTAEMYPVPPERELQGRTESYIGTWLAARKNRDSLVLASKVAGPSELIKTRDIPTRLDRENIMKAIDGSLMRLQTDHLDLYQVHWPSRALNYFGVRQYPATGDLGNDTIEETLSVLNDIVKSGKVRYIGVSNESPWGLMEYRRIAKEKGYPEIVSIQNQYSLTNRISEIGVSEVCLREEIGFLGYSPLNMGVLTGKYLDGAKPEGARFTRWQRSRPRYDPERAQAAIREYVSVAKKHDLDPATLAIAFSLSRPFMTAAIIGATSVEQLQTNIRAGDETLSEEIHNEIAAISDRYPDVTC